VGMTMDPLSLAQRSSREFAGVDTVLFCLGAEHAVALQSICSRNAVRCSLSAVKMQPNCSRSAVIAQSDCSPSAVRVQSKCSPSAVQVQSECSPSAVQVQSECSRLAVSSRAVCYFRRCIMRRCISALTVGIGTEFSLGVDGFDAARMVRQLCCSHGLSTDRPRH
jgi:hypothetical protein